MSSGQERVLRRRIRSIESTEKLTRAMDLISASQIVRAQNRIGASRPYAEGIGEILGIANADLGPASPLGGVPGDPRHVLVVAVVADRGLCGAYNSNVLRTADRVMRAGEGEGRAYSLVTIGRRAQRYFRFHGREIETAFVKMTERPTYEDACRVARELTVPFLAGSVDLVQLVSTRFRSAGIQAVEVRQLLPLAPTGRALGAGTVAEPGPPVGFYDFEPEAPDLLAALVPSFAEAAIFEALLEASASEHTARQRAMAAATENAEDLTTTLGRTMNRVRQDSITTEIMEIVGGAEAMRLAGRAAGSETTTDSLSEE
jgi:F-type H+-transporting ATPase subunit gamma